MMNAVRVWDFPTRVFHWTFALACIVAGFSGSDARYTDLHIFAGYLALAMLIFRLVWGFRGGRYARFSQFITGPKKLFQHFQHMMDKGHHHVPGHNPAGAVAIVVLLLLVLALCVTGMLVLGGEEGFGPLAGLLTIEQGDAIHPWHERLAWLLLYVVLAHLGGVFLMSKLQGENLVLAMVTGDKPAKVDEAEPENSTQLGRIMLVLIALYTIIWFFPYLLATEKEPYLPFVDASLKQNQEWHDNCDSCHVAYHPSLLPLHSWQRLFDEQMHHFGEGLYLDIETMVILRDYASKNSAEYANREVSWRTLKLLKPEDHPTRISETPYWKETHADIPEERWHKPPVYGKADCGACHHDAETGGFLNSGMSIPE